MLARQIAQLTAEVVNVFRGKDDTAAKAEDYMPGEKEPEPEQTTEQMVGILNLFAQMRNRTGRKR